MGFVAEVPGGLDSANEGESKRVQGRVLIRRIRISQAFCAGICTVAS